MAEIFTFPTVIEGTSKEPEVPEVNQALVDMLEDALKRAKGGELIAASMVMVHERQDDGRFVGQCYSDFDSVECFHLLMSGQSFLKKRMLEDMADEEIDTPEYDGVD